MEEGKGFDRAFFHFIRDRMGEEEADPLLGNADQIFRVRSAWTEIVGGHACFLNAPIDRAYQEDMG